MAACPRQVFSGITPGQFASLAQRGQQYGISIAGNTGQAERSGITVEWQYDPATTTLAIQCTQSPFYIPCATINGRIQDLIKSAVAQLPDQPDPPTQGS